MVTAEQARNLVRQAQLTAGEHAQILLLINTEADKTLPVFEGLEASEVAGVVREYLDVRRQAGAAAAPGTPAFYRDVILILPSSDDGSPERVRKYDKITYTTLQKVLDREGCDVVQDPISKEWVDFELLNLQDNMLLTAQRASTPIDKRVSTVEGFVESSVRGFEADAAEAMYQHMQQRHSSVQVLPIRNITSAGGGKREVDGAVLAADCAAILEAKQVLDDEAVHQLESCLDFMKTQQLTGMAAKLQGKKLVGYVAGRTITSDPNKVRKLVSSCQEKGYGILVTSGKGPSLGNSRIPRVEVKCTLRRSIYGTAELCAQLCAHTALTYMHA
jgi:hypothetical protein